MTDPTSRATTNLPRVAGRRTKAGQRPQHVSYTSDTSKSKVIASIVKTATENFATEFKTRLIADVANPNGVINRKRHNVYMAPLGLDFNFDGALSRSFDSSHGQYLEKMFLGIARQFYVVKTRVEGTIYPEQTAQTTEFLEGYKDPNNSLTPQRSHYDDLRRIKPSPNSKLQVTTRISDMYLIDEAPRYHIHHLAEMKSGGNIDNKKARAEKEALMAQFVIVANSLGPNAVINPHFATAYNMFGDGQDWNQPNVLQFFSKEELLIGRDFLNLICKSKDGYGLVLQTYEKYAPLIKDAIDEIKQAYGI